uniref:Sodium:solute symporter n=1 Tax=Bellilinea caldifistulae TaxID=360411 RepID=A0A7C4KYX4_9CHLR
MEFPVSNTTIIVFFIILFFAIRIGIGYYASRKVSNTTDYIVAGRRLPIYLTGASIMATWFAAETLMGASSTAYQYGFQGVVFDPFGAALCLFLSGFFFIRLMRRARYLTIIDFFERRFGKWMGIAGSIIQMITYFGWTAAQIVAGGNIVHALFGWPVTTGMLFVALIVVSYTMMGGMWADTLLDFIQMFLTAGGITLIFVAVMRAVGGWDAFISNAGSLYVSKPFTLLPIEGEGYLGYTGGLGWTYWVGAWMALGLGSIAAQDLMQRSMSARNEATAVHGTYLAAILYLGFGVLSPLIGIAMFAMNPNIAPEQTEFILVTATTEQLSPVLAGIFIAALASALMSTSDSSILAGASVFTENILPLFKKGLTEKSQLAWTRLMVFVIGLMSLLMALYAQTIYKLSVFAWTVILVGMFAPFAFGMYWKKANQSGALAGFLGGWITWLITLPILYPTTLEINAGDSELAIWDAAYIGSVPAFLVSVLLVVVVSLLTQKRDAPKPLTDVDYQVIETKDRLGLLPLKDALRKIP